MAAKFKLPLLDLCKEHEAIGSHLDAAKASMSESGGYRLKLHKVKAAHARMGDMINAAYESLRDDDGSASGSASDDMGARGGPSDSQPRGAESGPRGMDSAIPNLHRLAPGVSTLGENMDRLLKP